MEIPDRRGKTLKARWRRRLRGLRPASIHGRWLLLSVVLGLATVMLAAVAMTTMMRAHADFKTLDEQVLSTVVEILALAERVSHLAASAPYVAEMASPAQLQQARSELMHLQREVGLFASKLPQAGQGPADLPSLLSSLQGVLDELIQLKRDELTQGPEPDPALANHRAVLLASTSLLSDQLRRVVAAQVAAVSEDIARRKQAADRSVYASMGTVASVVAAAIVTLFLGFRTLRRSLNDLWRVTLAMTSLSEGRPAHRLPSLGRSEEIDALARAFVVFSENTQSLRQMADSLAAQKTLLQTVFDSMDDGLSVFDADNRLVTWNPQYVKLMGLPPDAVAPGISLEEVQRLMAPLAEGATGPGSLGWFNNQRQEKPVRLDAHFADGRVLAVRSQPMPGGGFVTLYNDLSARRALEIQVRQSQKMDVLGQLTGGVAHDFNNMLAAIMGNLQRLEDRQDLPPDAIRIVHRALKASERGALLTARLLAFARKQPLHPEPVPVDGMLVGLEDLIQYALGQEIEVLLDLQAEGAHVFIDCGQLENAILNLALNAGAAMPKGGSILFQTRLLDREEPSQVEITVTDTGHGMPAHVLERIFEPFFTTRKSEGSGLGLSIIYGFVKQSGGNIHVTSSPGAGTSFVIELPTTEQRALTTVAKTPLPPLPHPLHVLLVEDDPHVRDALLGLLHAQDIQVTAVAAIAPALEVLAAQRCDLVISDVGLGPSEDGLTLMQRIQQEHRLPVLLMSGLPPDLLAHRYNLQPTAHILRKPFTVYELIRAILRLLDSAEHGARQPQA